MTITYKIKTIDISRIDYRKAWMEFELRVITDESEFTRRVASKVTFERQSRADGLWSYPIIFKDVDTNSTFSNRINYNPEKTILYDKLYRDGSTEYSDLIYHLAYFLVQCGVPKFLAEQKQSERFQKYFRKSTGFSPSGAEPTYSLR